MDRKYTNAVVAAPTAYAVAGSYVLAAYERGSQVRDLFTLVTSPEINWQAIYALVAAFGLALLVAINYDLATAAVRSYRQKQFRLWNTPAHDAIAHILHLSAYGISLRKPSRNSPDYGLIDAIDAFVQAAGRGQVKVMGRRPGDPALVAIPKSEWVGATIDPASVRGGREAGARLVARIDGTERFLNLIVDLEEVRKIWPKDRGGRL